MYCRNCGREMDAQAAVCVNCGVAKGNGQSFCPNCGVSTAPEAAICTSCGVALEQSGMPADVSSADQKSKIAAGILGIFLGGFGVHNFYLGYTGKAVAQLLLSIFCLGVGSIWGFIEGILILCGSINTDANGIPLRD